MAKCLIIASGSFNFQKPETNSELYAANIIFELSVSVFLEY